MYGPRVLEHFERPRHVGDVEPADGVGETANEACGDRLRLSLRLAGGRIAEVKFRAVGCPPTVAAGSAVAEWATGRDVAEARGLSAERVERELLGGLPAGKRHAASLAAEALRLALAGARA